MMIVFRANLDKKLKLRHRKNIKIGTGNNCSCTGNNFPNTALEKQILMTITKHFSFTRNFDTMDPDDQAFEIS